MITYFPTLYPDELLYSLFARYYVKTGYLAYTYAAQDLYVNKTTRPDIEFINMLSSDAKQLIVKNMTIDEVIKKHTMFPYYGRFLKKDRRCDALNSLISMDMKYSNHLCIPMNKNGYRHLRYCPMCALEDRERYGETYWHRMHQMIGVNICPVHHCKLLDSSIVISSKLSPCLVSAEEEIEERGEACVSGNELECEVAEYVFSVFKSDVDMETDINIGDFLHSRMSNTKYLSKRGEQRNITLLHKDFADHYKDMPGNWFTELWQLQKVFTNYRFNMYEICLIALFLNIPYQDLVNMNLPQKTQQQLFDEEILRLHKSGLKYTEIAKRLNASYDVVKAIGEGKYGYYHYCLDNPKKGGAKKKDWNSFDVTMLPLVKDMIKKLCDSKNRPQKITRSKLEKLLHIPEYSLSNCPNCMEEINKHYESQEEYWAKELIWAAKKLIAEGQPLNKKRIRMLTNINKERLCRAIPYLNKYTDDKNLFYNIKWLVEK